MQAQPRSQQRLQDGDHLRAAHDLVEHGVHLVGRLDAPHARTGRRVAGFEIVDVGVLGGGGGPGDQLGDDLAHAGQDLAIEDVGHDDDAVALVGLDLLLADHLASSGLIFNDSAVIVNDSAVI